MKFPFWASVFTLAGAIVLFKLGLWQLDRMSWKASLLANLDLAYASDSSELLIQPDQTLQDIQSFERGFVEGVYLPYPEILVGPQVQDKKPGFHAYLPLQVGEEIIFVNRGWVPLAYKAERQGQESVIKGPVRVSGLVRQPEGAGWFVAGNEPSNNLWRWPDTLQFAEALGLSSVSSQILYAEREEFLAADGELPAPVPVRVAERPELSNNHFQYALFWFCMCGLLIIFYGLRFHNIIRRKT